MDRSSPTPEKSVKEMVEEYNEHLLNYWQKR